MLYSEDMTGHAVIGEAAVNLAVREQEITVDTLLTELGAMLDGEKLSGRRRRIAAAIGWLRDFRVVGVRSAGEKRWMMPDSPDSGSAGESVIRLQADDDDMR